MNDKYSVWKDETGLHVITGFSEALIDIGTQGFGNEVAVYDWSKCVEILMQREGFSRSHANAIVSSCAEKVFDSQTPVFVNPDEFMNIKFGDEETGE
jgi:hypothetical protein